MALSSSLIKHLESKLGGSILTSKPVSGGSINQVYFLQTPNASFLIKLNDKNAYPAMFELEEKGLKTIKQTNTIAVPEVILTGDAEGKSFLVLEWIDTQRASTATVKLLAKQLADMHKCSNEVFGLDYDNYMGSLKQSNKIHSTWLDFFIQERLMPQVSLAFDARLLTKQDLKDFDLLYNRLPGLFDEEQPSLIHGDLWSGNYLIGHSGKPYLIDPAISYGHREFDIAMTTLFGGFPKQFYNTYQECFPLNQGWEQRLDLWNLYPLLIHLNLFGNSYLPDILKILKKFD